LLYGYPSQNEEDKLCSTAQILAEESPQRLCVPNGVTVLVVVEVNIDVRKMTRPVLNPLSPTLEQLLIIVPLVFSILAMEPDIGEIRGHFHWRLRSAPVMNAEGYLVAPEQIENCWCIPACVAKFKSVAIASRQCG